MAVSAVVSEEALVSAVVALASGESAVAEAAVPALEEVAVMA